MGKVLIIGGSGFVGSRLISDFKNVDFINLDKNPSPLHPKISKIGKICSSREKSQIIDQKGREINIKNKGYFHKF